MNDVNWVFTVTGPIQPDDFGITDAHAHAWNEPQVDSSDNMPQLDDFDAAKTELSQFRNAGGYGLVDCQPGGAGRDGRKLRHLSEKTGVKIVASTGFHLRKYYPNNYWLFEKDPNKAADYFISELTRKLSESPEGHHPILAGQIKIACPTKPEDWAKPLMIGAAQAAISTGAAIHVHTERGAAAMRIFRFFESQGMDPEQLILAHMDKRPDLQLHQKLIKEGVMLEYDTFSRAKYDPENNVWQLLPKLLDKDFSEGIAIANDLAYKHEWQAYNGTPGLIYLPLHIIPKLQSLGVDSKTLTAITGKNIACRLARPQPNFYNNF